MSYSKQSKKRGWNDDDEEEIDFLKKEGEKVAAENAKLEEENQAKAAKEAIRQKNLSKFQGTGKQPPSAEMKTSGPSGKIEQKEFQPNEPPKFINNKGAVGGNQFKKWNSEENGKQETPQNSDKKAQPQGPSIIKKEQKVKLGGDEEAKFEEQRRLAKEKMERLEQEEKAEQKRLEEEKKAKLEKVKNAADKFKPKAPVSEPEKQVKAVGPVEAKQSKTDEKQAPKDAKNTTVAKKQTTAKTVTDSAPKEQPLTQSKAAMSRKWADDDEAPINFNKK